MQMGAYRMFRKHSDWVECLVVVKITINGQTSEEIFTAGADGVVLRWLRDTEQNCDIYQCVVSRGVPKGGIELCNSNSKELFANVLAVFVSNHFLFSKLLLLIALCNC